MRSTMTSLDEELEKANTKLQQTEKKLHQSRSSSSCDDVRPPRQRLRELKDMIDSMELIQHLAKWHQCSTESLLPTLVQDARLCVALGKILLDHPISDLSQYVFENEYQPLYCFVSCQLRRQLRMSLRSIKYPSKEATLVLQEEMDTFSSSSDQISITAYSFWLVRSQTTDEGVRAHFSGNPNHPGRLDCVAELCRPIVERVTFHFLQEAEERISSTRIDRLPEWLLGYIREHVFLGGPWAFVEELASALNAEAVAFQFLNEICQLANYIIVQRNFFRHSKIVGLRSTPILLSGAIEQLLTFDAFIRDQIDLDQYPLSLTQSLVAEDQELWDWFLSSERRWALSTLFDTPMPSSLDAQLFSSRAELFSAIIQSIQSKSALLSKPSSYIAHVGVPICQSFLDAIHESSTELKGLLGQRKLIATQDLEKNLRSWVDLINGTCIAAGQMTRGGTKMNHDLSRVGRSLERLRDALVDECASTIVETVIVERAKLASYMMRCSHMLSLDDPLEHTHELSHDLHATATILWTVSSACNDGKSVQDRGIIQIGAAFAPSVLRRNVIDRVAEKFLEVALNVHGMTPEITLAGAKHFHDDVVELFGDPPHPPLTMRLLEVVRFMTIDPKPFQELRRAISDLLGHGSNHEPIDLALVEGDGIVLDEAVSMIRAKGYSSIYLEDALCILNRRERA